MPWADVALVFQWWGTLFLVGAAAYPLTRALKLDYFFSKAVGLAAVTFLILLGGVLRIVPFTQGAVWGAIGITFAIGLLANLKFKIKNLKVITDSEKDTRKEVIGFIAKELFFFAALFFWAWVKGHEPSIRGLEKFMDFGFTKSILNGRYFPPADMWYAGYPINYYYFGHTVMAVLTRLSGIDLSYTFNLMLTTLFALSLTMSFAIGKQLVKGTGVLREIAGGALTAFLVTLAGNMQTIYAFTQGYEGDRVVPFWTLKWTWEGLSRYWYANATRFIPYTIHEFPSYSLVVSDVHGQVLSIPFVLLAIALLIKIWGSKGGRGMWGEFIFYGFVSGVLLMTNALDGPIYFALLVVILFLQKKDIFKKISFVFVSAALTSLPFTSFFRSFVNGIAINCPPGILANTRIGPLIFEGVEKCQRSPLWMLALLWGFFIYCGVWLLTRRKKPAILIVFFVFSVLLVIFPEFFYFKDIYPLHFRSNTMFKLGYQAYIMFSIVSAYAIVKLRNKWFYLFLVPQLFLVSIYPYFSVRSYFGELKRYQGLYGLTWLQNQYPDNFAAIGWLTAQPAGTIVEADGDSYTDYDQFSAFTGRPTIIGWAVHEWLWRGSYDVVAPRREEVRRIYESADVSQTRSLLAKYNVRYVIVGSLERQKFAGLNEQKFRTLGKEAFRSGTTVIYVLAY